MTRLLTFPRLGLLAAGLTLLPVGAFAQVATQDARTTAPVATPAAATDAKPADAKATNTVSAASKTVDASVTDGKAPYGKTAAPMTRHIGAHEMKHASVLASGVKKTTAPATSTTPVQAKTVDPSKS